MRKHEPRRQRSQTLAWLRRTRIAQTALRNSSVYEPSDGLEVPVGVVAATLISVALLVFSRT